MTIALGDYAAPLSAMVLALKNAARLDLARAFGRLLAHRAAARLPPGAMIVPVPLAHDRLRERGFNQALEIARPVAAAGPWPLHRDLVLRVDRARPQQLRSAAARRRNVADAFLPRCRVDGATIAIVDDVMTTGSTIDALAATLKSHGATRVLALVVARAG